jgi:hypothetical protein
MMKSRAQLVASYDITPVVCSSECDQEKDAIAPNHFGYQALVAQFFEPIAFSTASAYAPRTLNYDWLRGTCWIALPFPQSNKGPVDQSLMTRLPDFSIYDGPFPNASVYCA